MARCLTVRLVFTVAEIGVADIQTHRNRFSDLVGDDHKHRRFGPQFSFGGGPRPKQYSALQPQPAYRLADRDPSFRNIGLRAARHEAAAEQ